MGKMAVSIANLFTGACLMNAVGIDVSKGKSMVAVLRPLGVVVTKPFEVGHTAADWGAFATAYGKLLDARFTSDRASFDALAALAAKETVLLGCSCPSAANPDVARCHTTLALAFMKKKYPRLDVQMPEGTEAR